MLSNNSVKADNNNKKKLWIGQKLIPGGFYSCSLANK